MFAGLAQTGAWACLDEFNRIEVEVLSVVASQISVVMLAIKEGKNTFDFYGQSIRLIPSCGIFVTMNPGYAGRSELPDNLKVRFCLFCFFCLASVAARAAASVAACAHVPPPAPTLTARPLHDARHVHARMGWTPAAA